MMPVVRFIAGRTLAALASAAPRTPASLRRLRPDVAAEGAIAAERGAHPASGVRAHG